ncbi:MAG: RNA polymerase sigma factor [Bacteroidetes bacterium]|nr:RNA polymerase sigma factor [Bacteroidota bacterium]MBL6963386.1 RNA polymerase sigma factor [Bacteroidota bacterium]
MTLTEYNESVDNYSDNIYRFILKNIKDEDKAKDIVQETFIKLWNKVEEVSGEKVKSYLFTTAYRTMIDMIRRDKRIVDFDQIDQGEMIHSKQYTDVKEILNSAIDKLPEIQKSVILLRDYEGYSYQDIAEITGLNDSQVKVYIYRARVFLKNKLKSIDYLI